MIKIELHLLEGTLDIEIKKNEDYYLLVVILSKSDYFKEEGRAWNGKTRNEEKVQAILKLIKDCYVNPSIAKRVTVHDGRVAKVTLKEDKSEIHYSFKDSFEEGQQESKLLGKTMEFINETIQDEILKKYTIVFGRVV